MPISALYIPEPYCLQLTMESKIVFLLITPIAILALGLLFSSLHWMKSSSNDNIRFVWSSITKNSYFQRGDYDSSNNFKPIASYRSDDISNAENKPRRRMLTAEDEDENVTNAKEDDFVQTTKKQHYALFEVSDIFSTIGPTVFPKPTQMYYNQTNNNNNNNSNQEERIVTFLQPISGSHRPNQDAVFVFCAEYQFETFLLFFMTLCETGYKGDVVIGISQMDWDSPSIRELLEFWQKDNKEHMTVVVYVVPYHCYDLEGNVHPSHRGGMRVCQCHNMFGRRQENGTRTPLLDQRHGRTAQTIRYELYWIWSLEYHSTSWILLIDARDTIFQETPFRTVPQRRSSNNNNNNNNKEDEGGMLIFFGENADATSLGKSKYNRRWLILAYGEIVANAFRDKPTLCSGSTMGEQVAVESYLRAQVAESDESKTVIFGADQGFHNYLYYSNKLANAKAIQQILVQDQGLGIVNNMGALRDKSLSEWGNGNLVKKNDTTIAIYNWDGTVSPVVHQYDRHKELSNWWHKKKYVEYKKKLEKMKQANYNKYNIKK